MDDHIGPQIVFFAQRQWPVQSLGDGLHITSILSAKECGKAANAKLHGLTTKSNEAGKQHVGRNILAATVKKHVDERCHHKHPPRNPGGMYQIHSG